MGYFGGMKNLMTAIPLAIAMALGFIWTAQEWPRILLIAALPLAVFIGFYTRDMQGK